MMQPNASWVARWLRMRMHTDDGEVSFKPGVYAIALPGEAARQAAEDGRGAAGGGDDEYEDDEEEEGEEEEGAAGDETRIVTKKDKKSHGRGEREVRDETTIVASEKAADDNVNIDDL